jgi:multidrug efflux pump subunit AcrB
MAVVFAMFTSYCLSRTLTPIMIGLLIRTEYERHCVDTGWFARLHTTFNAKFDQFRDFYGWLLGGILQRP